MESVKILQFLKVCNQYFLKCSVGAGGAAVQTLPELPGCSAGTAGQASPPRRAARVAAMGQDVYSAPQGSALLGSAVWLRIPQSDLTGPAGHAAGSVDGTACADLASAGAERTWES